MKKLATLLTVALFAVNFSACTKTQDAAAPMDEAAPAGEVQVMAEPTPPPPPPMPMEVTAPAPVAEEALAPTPPPPPAEDATPPVE